MNVQAQYLGGDGDGFVSTTILQLDITGVPAGIRPLFVGGAGDGFSDAISLTSPNGTDLTNLYTGGDGDGFDQQSTFTALEGTTLEGLFAGGEGDGFDIQSYTASLEGESITGLFIGGDGDGFDVQQFEASLNGTTVTGLFTGGDGDGFDVHLFAGGLMGEILTLYNGGDGDGFDQSSTSHTISGQSMASLYSGGDGDGFDVTRYEGIVPLPLTLISFEAIPEATFVVLKWITEDEQSTDFFIIEKTKTGQSFDYVGQLDAAGFSEPGERIHYELIDEQPWQGTSFYRLKTTDFDGAVSLSHLVEVQYDRPGQEHSFELFPNPNTGQHFSLRLQGYQPNERCFFEVISMHGQQLFQGQFYPGNETSHRFELPQSLSSGSYLIRLRSEDGKVDSKILLIK